MPTRRQRPSLAGRPGYPAFALLRLGPHPTGRCSVGAACLSRRSGGGGGSWAAAAPAVRPVTVVGKTRHSVKSTHRDSDLDRVTGVGLAVMRLRVAIASDTVAAGGPWAGPRRHNSLRYDDSESWAGYR